ncbi:Endonuclease III-like protein 1 [Lunasporangiospora selenospora]|uniref:Endonuclease III-like protein 1 n=1 Tax=Lunasporangiospora selenospora TaxID=979761 RepID=A0A9P6FM12_9FUNG|nr:Endonuclease III-like protein 1 [Lunasporangiospora selenospora]
MALESWLPKEHWREINVILVGFGQVLCLPRGPLCYTCPVQDRCPSATGIPNRKKIKTLIKDESDSPLGEVELHPVHIKTEAPDVAVKLEKDDGETSKYFSETLVPVKQEEEESSSMHDNVLDSTLVDSSRLKDENIDIEDLVP